MRPTLADPLRIGSGLRTKSAWVIVVPFFLLAGPSGASLAAGATLALLGLALRGWSAGTIQKGEVLTVSGPYAHVRNPLYVGSFLIGAGLAVAGGSVLWLLLFLLFFAALYGPTVASEAARLTEQFGHRYVEYAGEVPAFIPRLKPYKGGGVPAPFRWSQYERNREWEAMLGAAAAFALLWLKMVWLG
ncbi:MAG: isoprenylcysteine carboxylmethyltransferase family protein [Gemmatimonadetes bacterium]|nr:isoprenylcysteine carboxylmethyltransferase family protein [Gemmatimonadota bacterium]